MSTDDSRIKKAAKFGTALGKKVLCDNVPIVNSFIGALDDIDEQKEKEELDAKLKRIEETTSTTLSCVSNLDNLTPLLDPKPSLKKIYEVASILNSTISSNQNYDVEIISIDKSKKELRITPKKAPIELNLKLKTSTQKLEGMSCFEELIESKIKEGKSVVFTEDEIESLTFLDEEIRKFWGTHSNFKELECKPQISDLPFDFSLIVESTEIAYHNIKMGSIYKNENEATLVTTNLPFKMLLRIRKDLQKININFSVDVKNTYVLDLDKFWNFLSALNDGNRLILKDSKRGTVFFETNEIPIFDIDESIAKFTKKLAMIDTVYCTNFTFPENVTDDDIRTINEIIFIIENKYIKISDLKVSFISKGLDELIKKYEERGYFENIRVEIPISYELFGKTIDIGMGRVFLNKAFTLENITQLKRQISKKEEIDITFIPEDEDARIIFQK